MKLKDLKANLPTEDGSREILRPLLNMFSSISQNQVHQFTEDFVHENRDIKNRTSEESFGDFVKEQNELIIKLIGFEMNDVGTYVREMEGLTPLTDDTEIG